MTSRVVNFFSRTFFAGYLECAGRFGFTKDGGIAGPSRTGEDLE